MKAFLSFALVAAILIPAFAQAPWGGGTDTANFAVTGKMPAVVKILVSGVTPFLDLQTPSADMTLATVTTWCNKAAGYTISAYSSNAGQVTGGSPVVGIGYKIKFGSGGTSLAPGASGSPVQIANILGKTPKTGTPTTLSLTFVSTDLDVFLDEGNYSDSLTLTIAANN